MKIRIYQINMERDINLFVFMSLDTLEKTTGSPAAIDSSIYDLVYEGDVDCQSLEQVFQVFNLQHPADYEGRSLSVSDVVEVVENPKDNIEIIGNETDELPVKRGFYYCNDFGFKQVEFDADATQKQAPKRIRVVLLKPGKLAQTVEIGASLESMQAAVGGDIEPLYPFEEAVCIICNEEGKINGLPLNRAVYQDAEYTELTYGELAARFREAERSGKHLDGLITFTEDSFTKWYSLAARTYFVSSENKAFQPNMGGYSIFGSAVDGSDLNVRLERYMAKEKGGKDGWKIERCYLRNGGEMIDIIAGTCFICDCSGDHFGGLSEEQATRYAAMFRLPEAFIQTGSSILALPYMPSEKPMSEQDSI